MDRTNSSPIDVDACAIVVADGGVGDDQVVRASTGSSHLNAKPIVVCNQRTLHRQAGCVSCAAVGVHPNAILS